MSSDKMEIDEVESRDKLFENLNEDLNAIKSKSNKTKKRKLSSAHTPPSPPITKEYLRKEDVIKSRKTRKMKRKVVAKTKKVEEDMKMDISPYGSETDMKMDISPYGSETGKKELIAVEYQKKVLKKFVSNKGTTMVFMKKNVRKAYYDAYIKNMNRIKTDRQYEMNENRGLNTTTIVTTSLLGHGGDIEEETFDDDTTLILSTTGICGIPGLVTDMNIWYINHFEKNIKNHIIINKFLIETQRFLKPWYKKIVKDYLKNNKDHPPNMKKYLSGMKFADYMDLNCSFIVPLCNRKFQLEGMKLKKDDPTDYAEFRIIDVLTRHLNKDGSISIERFINYPKDINELYSRLSYEDKKEVRKDKHTSLKMDGKIRTISLKKIVDIIKNVYGINTNINIIDASCRTPAEEPLIDIDSGLIPGFTDEEFVVWVNEELKRGYDLASSTKRGD